jgi:threonine 3-dehydrogenase
VKKVRPQVIYHLGAMLSTPSDADPAAALQTNVMGTFHMLEAARLFEVRQVLFSSSISTYALDVPGEVVDDATIQRPLQFYGATKLFGEHLGLFYKRRYGLDFRGIRYPSTVGPGVKTPGAMQYTSWMIEECARGRPFTAWVRPETRRPVIYFKDVARAIIELGQASLDSIKSVNYLLAGTTPMVSAGELAELVRAKIPGAQIDFQPNPALQAILDRLNVRFDDRRARAEWGWAPQYTQEQIIDDFLLELQRHPQ